MKSIFITTIAILFFSFPMFSQSLGDIKKQEEVFGNQPVWNQLNKNDLAEKMTFKDYRSCGPNDKIIAWNASTKGEAEVESFLPTDSIFVVTRKNGDQFLYKVGCHNRLEIIRIEKPAPLTYEPAPTPKFVVDAPTVVHYPKDWYIYPAPWGQPNNTCRSGCNSRPNCSSTNVYSYQSPWDQPRTICGPRPSCGSQQQGFYGSRRNGAPAYRRNR